MGQVIRFSDKLYDIRPKAGGLETSRHLDLDRSRPLIRPT
jgi:hypothetical protein